MHHSDMTIALLVRIEQHLAAMRRDVRRIWRWLDLAGRIGLIIALWVSGLAMGLNHEQLAEILLAYLKR
jgi:hypothetical protein